MQNPGDIDMSECGECSRVTRHKILYSESRGREVGDDITVGNVYQVIECQGCETVKYRTRNWCSAWVNEGDDSYIDYYYPPLALRRTPEWVGQLPDGIQSVMEEVNAALQAGSRYLASIGARTILDMVIVEKVGDVGSFKDKVSKLQTDGHITKAEANLINTVLEAGSASAHRGYAPEPQDINHVMDILESVLEKFYVLEGKAAALKKNIPPRP